MYAEPIWTWDEATGAGYVDLIPSYEGVRKAKILRGRGPVAIIADLDVNGVVVGVEVLV